VAEINLTELCANQARLAQGACAIEDYCLEPHEALALIDSVEAAHRYLDASDDHPDLGAFFADWLKSLRPFYGESAR
jgi:hypothetical protein